MKFIIALAIFVGLGLRTYAVSVVSADATGNLTASTFISVVGTGTPPFTVASATNVPNLNASSINGQTFTSPTIATPTISGAIAFPAGVDQTFNPNSTASGINVGSMAGNPGTLANGDIWYNTSTNTLEARISGSTTSLGAGGAPAGSSSQVQYNASGSFGANTGFTTDSSGNVTVHTLTSSVSTGTAPFTVSSATNVANLNASSLNGATFAAPGTIGGTTPGTVNFSTLTPSSNSAAAAAVVALTPTTVSNTEASGAVTINWAASPTQTLTLNANLGTVTFSGEADGMAITVYVTNTTGNYTVTWGNSIKWPGATQPTQTTGAHTDRWVLQDVGGTYYGSVTQNY